MSDGNLEESVMLSLQRVQVATLIVAVLLITLITALPAAAQEDDDLTMVSGALDLTRAGDMFVAGYLIDLTGTSLPPLLHDGDIVLVVGTLLADGKTLQASSIEQFDTDTDGDGVIDSGDDEDDDANEDGEH